MFKDVQKSKELMVGFRQKYSDFESELVVSVCTTGAWPANDLYHIKQDPDIAILTETYTKYYLSRFSGRKLYFDMSKGRADVLVQFNAKCKKILIVSSYQMTVLLLFNYKKTWTFGDMLKETSIPKEELEAAVLSMAHPKIKVMRKAPNTKEIEDGHKFQINPKYTNPRAKIPIPILLIKPFQPPVSEGVSALRRHQMDAAIRRVSKRTRWTDKPISHQDLVTEVIKQLRPRFTPKSTDIKKRIANLIDLEYLERDEEKRGHYWSKM